MSTYEILVTEAILATPELMEAIRQGKEDRKAGRGRPYEEFAKEDVVGHESRCGRSWWIVSVHCSNSVPDSVLLECNLCGWWLPRGEFFKALLDNEVSERDAREILGIDRRNLYREDSIA